MSNKKITDLDSLTTAASGDLIPIVDVSDTTQAASGSTKKITSSNLLTSLFASPTFTGTATFDSLTATGTVTLTGATIVNSGTLTLPTSTDTIIGRATTDTLTNKTLTAPKFASGGFIADANGNELLIFTTTASAVNEVTLANGDTGVNPKFTASGETNVGLDFQAKGSGTYRLLGTSSQAAELRLYEDTDDGNNYSAIKTGTQSADITYTLPTAAPSSNGQSLTATTAGVMSWASPAATKIEVDATEITVANTVTETTLFDCTVPGGTLSTSNAVKIRIFLSSFSCQNSNTLTLKLKYGSTTLVTAVNNVNTFGTNVASLKGWVDAYLIADGGTSAQKGVLWYECVADSAEENTRATVGVSKVYASGNGTASENSQNDLTVSITATWSVAHASNTVTGEFWTVEKIA